jgi:hypothetical protein
VVGIQNEQHYYKGDHKLVSGCKFLALKSQLLSLLLNKESKGETKHGEDNHICAQLGKLYKNQQSDENEPVSFVPRSFLEKLKTDQTNVEAERYDKYSHGHDFDPLIEHYSPDRLSWVFSLYLYLNRPHLKDEEVHHGPS